MQDTGKFRNTKDQYYTKDSVAKKCIHRIVSLLPISLTYEWIEPSAGNGAFFKQVPAVKSVGLDIDPKYPNIQQADFLTWTPSLEEKRILFGNPPFGRQGSLAKSFIKHAAKYAEIIAFILPRSFVKPSMSRAFPLNFHCIHSEELEKNSFEVNKVEYDVPCVFQIWEKKDTLRTVPPYIQESGFEYVKHDQPFHLALKRVGGLAGKSYVYGAYNPQYHYFLKFEEKYIPHLEVILGAVNKHTFPSNTVGPRSLSKSEVNEVVNQILVRLP
jgi:hypothetical protein